MTHERLLEEWLEPWNPRLNAVAQLLCRALGIVGTATDCSDMAKKSKSDPQAVNAYLATLPRAERETLTRLRTLIKETIPQVDERVSYGTTVMFSLGRDLVGFVSQPKHLSFFTASPKLAQAMKTTSPRPTRSAAPRSISHRSTRFRQGW
jgi:hypothetical protein